MVIPTEELFFKTFNINNCDIGTPYECSKKGWECSYCENKYPEITDEILVKLICIVFNTFGEFDFSYFYTPEMLKVKVLKMLVLAQDDVYSQVLSIFTKK